MEGFFSQTNLATDCVWLSGCQERGDSATPPEPDKCTSDERRGNWGARGECHVVVGNIVMLLKIELNNRTQ